ncbi:urate oxidase-like protein [Thermochaetoides thermophila DSM 1495]|uniref:Uricase n=1 Tax=Chaetomium thermophilum (strain DSM 1495 / CBS 144.50 / IMI 039719) TaxID=759272 RepID=G0SFM4_CHATD|nr:urate oxidase-like protein [Thermochaetoides thermophila DSM 1495]EGS17789.1 urate oxidase-like protein [Thermochaetoides thermophila DSM 1495]
MPSLSAARYGKDNVRVYKVHRDEKTGVHTVTEMTVCALVEGDIETSYTKADNSVVVATDSIKNTIYIKAKEFPVNPPELFAAKLGQHFLDKYAHLSVAHIDIKVHRWTRMVIDGEPHPHSFWRDGEETRNVSADISREGITIRSGIRDLTVLKSTGSAFHGFVRDEFTTLPEVWDRIMSTDVDSTWTWKKFNNLAEVEEGVERFNKTYETARNIVFKVFAIDDSASVQATMYRMCEQILEAAPEVDKVAFSLPNKHYFEIDLSWHKGIKNTGKDAEVYMPFPGPNGLIKCEVSRS